MSNIAATNESGTIMTWSDVSAVHKTRHGIYQRNGVVISLLTDFGHHNPCYPDFHGDTSEVIHYTGNGRRGDQKLDAFNRALLDAVSTEICVPLFNKLSPGKWQCTGKWRIANGVYIFDENQSRMVWKFTLQKAD